MKNINSAVEHGKLELPAIRKNAINQPGRNPVIPEGIGQCGSLEFLLESLDSRDADTTVQIKENKQYAIQAKIPD